MIIARSRSFRARRLKAFRDRGYSPVEPEPRAGAWRALLSLSAAVFCCSVCKDEALKCHTCVAADEEECDQQGSFVCPQYSDACATITGPNTVMKSCSYRSFCERPHHGNPGVRMECCFTENCNGPQSAYRHGEHRNSAGGLGPSPPLLLLGALLARLATSRV
ncbi:hypothetical protein ANANG_G00270360 [Anguilla anguilla]|uniref:UPAR/Ly6 domain-containing protein n=1 Tax=Anguilla anguilla TaxID=7936 RepID=A0A9D3LQU1_ANGAN|nr:hypothetical protein ANANG_G00270360 [Anguilla anguilla]